MVERALESVEGTQACIARVINGEASDRAKRDVETFYSKHKHVFDSGDLRERFYRETAMLLDERTALLTRIVPADVESVWGFLANPQNLAKWMFPAEFEAKLGATFNFAPDGWHGTIGAYEEGREIRFDAVAGGWTWFSLIPRGDETEFQLRDYMAPDLVIPDDARSADQSLQEDQPGGPGTHWQGVLSGWHCGVDDLRALFTKQPTVWDYESLTKFYRILIEDYHRPA